MLRLLTMPLLFALTMQAHAGFETVQFPSGDGLQITGDLYQAHQDKSSPFIVLCHQAGWSRGEYREIAPRLNELGFNCLAIDQRSGGEVNGVRNETHARAATAGRPTEYVHAEQDIVAAVNYARTHHATGHVILWGSSYSSALSLRIAGEKPELVDGVLAFAPGEYFTRSGKPANWITTSAAKIQCPAFVTSARNELQNWKAIYAAIPSKAKTQFLPATKGNHGSRALWGQMSDSSSYWTAVNSFLNQFR